MNIKDIKEYLISEIANNEPFTMSHDPIKYKIDRDTLTYINYQLITKGVNNDEKTK
mgnify:CR=1 FL=1